jgi:hypothetical protein
MYRVRSTGEVLSQGQVRSIYPNTSFPKTWTPELVEELGLDPVFETPAPTTMVYQTAFKDGVEQDAKGNWVWKWTMSELDAEAKAAKDAEAAKAVRAKRDNLIAETDWLVIKNLELNQNVPGKWEVYRQDLRDIPQQAGFPHNVTWPVKPE